MIVIGYLYFCIPCILCCCLCMCLPVLIVFMIYAQPNGQSPATDTAIERLRHFKYSAEENLQCKECVICMQSFAEGEDMICLDCDNRHAFHAECLKRWLRINNTCPICRQVIA